MASLYVVAHNKLTRARPGPPPAHPWTTPSLSAPCRGPAPRKEHAMLKRLLGAGVGLVVMTLLAAACGNDSGSKSGGSGQGSGKAGVILPDAATSPRWEGNDRPLLAAAFKAANIPADTQKPAGAKSKFATIWDSTINT